ncbi:hypothetical protein Nepgr_022836 [Nepenthes gracilis]|uniref:Uncharacterized protein n=1 Tax=Nepenthes gracilis TaxID=150966 RepID=A0AAD3T1I2_NEPGR|nr:hypothetical protein Nepgr_022836 [Nepenthes gracilis]
MAVPPITCPRKSTQPETNTSKLKIGKRISIKNGATESHDRNARPTSRTKKFSSDLETKRAVCNPPHNIASSIHHQDPRKHGGTDNKSNTRTPGMSNNFLLGDSCIGLQHTKFVAQRTKYISNQQRTKNNHTTPAQKGKELV